MDVNLTSRASHALSSVLDTKNNCGMIPSVQDCLTEMEKKNI